MTLDLTIHLARKMHINSSSRCSTQLAPRSHTMRLASCGFALLCLAALSPLALAVDPPQLGKLTAALASASAEERYAAADALADLGLSAQAAVPQIAAALAADDPHLRWRAARALGTTGSPAAAPVLQKAANDEEPLVRAQAIFALGRLRAADEQSLATIVSHLTDKEVQVRRACVRALRLIEAPRATVIPLVIKLLEDADPAVAMRALSSIAEGGVEVVPALTAALERPEARYWACLALAEIGSQAKDAVPALIKALADERPEVRLQATIALAEIGPEAKPAAGALIRLVNDDFESVRVGALFALGRIGDRSADEALAKAEQSEQPVMRMLALWALARLHKDDVKRQEAAIAHLVGGLGQEDGNISAIAARALADLNPPPEKARPLVEKMIAEKPETADRVISAFASLGARAVPHAITALKDPQRRVRALQVIARIGPEAAPAVPVLAELLNASDAATKTETLFALAAIGPDAKAAVEPMIEALSDSDVQVKQTAAYALGKIGPEARAAVPALSKLASSDDQLLRLTAIWAVLRIGPRTPEMTKSALPILAEALKHSREFVRLEAAMTLGDLGQGANEAIPALEAARSDPSAAVRSAADAAIKKIR
jgi:HEAT repeat protein